MPDQTRRWGVEDAVVCWRQRTVLNHVSITADPGEIVAVVGGDGAGKSTLLRVVTGRVIPASGTPPTSAR